MAVSGLIVVFIMKTWSKDLFQAESHFGVGEYDEIQ